MFLLPWEKLPAWILGPLVMFAGGAIVVAQQPWTWSQFEGWVGILMGMGIFIHGVTRPPPATDESPRAASARDRVRTQDGSPDFARYTKTELLQILDRLDSERFPERAKEVRARLAAFDAAPE